MVKRIAKQLIDCFERGNKCLIAGNGGSSTMASHFAGELVCKFETERRALPAIALTNPAIITAVANDDGYEHVFARQVEALGKKGDILIILSTSGRSKNI